jgi:hypothetical protein
MILNAKFDVIYMEEALAFLETLPDKVQDKIAYNNLKVVILLTKSCLRS